MQPAHLPDLTFLDSLPKPTAESPLPVLFSACLAGTLCGFDGTDNGSYPVAQSLLKLPQIKPVLFCPEHFSFGTPRELCDIHGGTGQDVLDGNARVLTEAGNDWTEGMIRGAEQMLKVALENNVQLAILLDISAACGSQVISNGQRTAENRSYRIGAGVAAALLIRNGIKVISQRDFKSLQLFHHKIDPSFKVAKESIDHHQTDWYRQYFSGSTH